MATDITSDEQQQILQTIDMFEMIVESNPDDYQSLTLLRDAYSKLERGDDVRRIELGLGRAYLRLGQYQAAVSRLQGLVDQHPDNTEAVQLLNEAQNQIEAMETVVTPVEGKTEGGIDLDFGSFGGAQSGLILNTASPSPAASHPSQGADIPAESVDIAVPEDDGNEALAKFLLGSELVPGERIGDCLQRTRDANAQFTPERVNVSMLTEIIKECTEEEGDTIYNSVIEHCKYGFVPLDRYDVDRQIVQMLPEEITLGRLIVPFDLISRTIMIAMCNPFDAPGKIAVQESLDYNIIWYFATPEAITKALTSSYRLTA